MYFIITLCKISKCSAVIIKMEYEDGYWIGNSIGTDFGVD
jgi:hypothetical protein